MGRDLHGRSGRLRSQSEDRWLELDRTLADRRCRLLLRFRAAPYQGVPVGGHALRGDPAGRGGKRRRERETGNSGACAPDNQGRDEVQLMAPLDCALVARKSDDLDDWWVIERAE